MGKQSNIFHQYIIYKSIDRKNWDVLIDKSNNKTDVPHDYVELEKPTQARYLRIENIHVPTGKFALSGFRVFGKGNGKAPETVKHFVVLRGESESRNAWIKWKQSDDATGYTIYFGISPNKLYSNILVYNSNEYFFKGMDKDQTYYFAIEAFNENGISPLSETVKSKATEEN
jgi:xylan 1,4-beta-xylosidase